VAPELDVVKMGRIADTEYADMLVGAAIERALTGVGLRPHHQIQHLIVHRAAGLEQFAEMAPIHAHEVDGAVAGDRSNCRQALRKEFDKARARELAGAHGKFGVFDLAAADDVTDADIVGRIEESHRSAGFPD
jgi:hypothetical protein